MNDVQSPHADAGLITGEHDYASLTDQVSAVVLRRRTPRSLLAALAVAFALFLVLNGAIAYLLIRGVGIWGVNVPVAWGFAIVNFVWWIGIGHAGTLISAILLLMRERWRNSINRFAEAMTLFAVACAGMFPLLHLGRPYLFYWLLPYPDTMGLWPQWRSPLVWDAFAVMTYFIVSLLFWYLGLLPDLATMRDRAGSRRLARLYGVLALGWTGSARSYQRYQSSYLLLAGLATPLVVSVHSIVSMDFAVTQLPGWHSTIFPPYFVAGAIYSGFAMVLILVLPVRALFSLHDLITERHVRAMIATMLASGLFVAYGYAMEGYDAWYSSDEYERFMMWNRLTGPYWPATWGLLICNVVLPQLLWLRAVQRQIVLVFVLSLVINYGMWLERYVIVITSLHRDFLPSSWGMYHGTRWDWAILLGSLGLFTTLMLLFLRSLPAISMSEIRHLWHQTRAPVEESR
jgi:molybdopterin-containing oxidoreductase family membrane subunit